MGAIPIRDVTTPAPHAHVERAPAFEAPYRSFITASLLLGIVGGFSLAVLLPLARVLDWGWGRDASWAQHVQIHGQMQLMGFAGLFVTGMALRLLPRVAARPLAWPKLVPALIPLIGGSLLLRALAQPLADGPARDITMYLSAGLFVAGALAFAAIAWGTLWHRDSRAEATGWFFSLAAAALVASSLLNLVQVIELARDGLDVAPVTRQTALLFTQQFGFLLLFVGGVGSRAIPTLTGQPRRQIAPRAAALLLAIGVALFAVQMLRLADGATGETWARAGAAGLLLVGLALAMLVWISGALLPGNRVAAASRTQFLFVRSAFAWMAFSAVLICWYAARAFVDARPLDQYEIDAIRHAVTVGVLMFIIIGMAMLIVPEFAGRRLQHPDESRLLYAMLATLHIAAGLRLWPALEGTGWLGDTRFWPIAVSGILASAVIILFAAMFWQSWWEQRDPKWAAEATKNRG